MLPKIGQKPSSPHFPFLPFAKSYTNPYKPQNFSFCMILLSTFVQKNQLFV